MSFIRRQPHIRVLPRASKSNIIVWILLLPPPPPKTLLRNYITL